MEIHTDEVTVGEELIEHCEVQITRLRSFYLSAYNDETLRRIVETLGSRTERFLKSAVWPGSPIDATFSSVIDRLKALGISKVSRSKLHQLRNLYNSAKHDAGVPLKLRDVLDTAVDATGVLRSIIETGTGATGEFVSRSAKHLLWVSIFDDYANGVSEVYVSLPREDAEFMDHLDIFWIDVSSWDDLKRDLLQTENFQYGRELFSSQVMTRFCDEQDFTGAGIWEGNYGHLIAMISLHEDRSIANKVFSFLRRDHMHISVLSAIALAGVDVARTDPKNSNLCSLQAAILERANSTYAMPSDRSWVRRAGKHMAALLKRIPPEKRKMLTGPYWNLWQKEEIKAVARSGDKKYARYMIDDLGRVIIY